MDGWKKADPPTIKELPIEVDILEFLVKLVTSNDTEEGEKATANLTLIAFYYLLQVGEYTYKQKQNDEKQTVHFRSKDVTFFKRDEQGCLRQLSWKATKEEIMTADICTLKLTSKKNGWRGVCINHYPNINPTL